MIDPKHEEIFHLLDSPAKVPWLPRQRNGKPVSRSTLIRLASDKRRPVRLETIRFAGAMWTSEAAWRRYFAAMSNLQNESREVGQPEAIDVEAAERECVAAGI